MKSTALLIHADSSMSAQSAEGSIPSHGIHGPLRSWQRVQTTLVDLMMPAGLLESYKDQDLVVAGLSKRFIWGYEGSNLPFLPIILLL